MYVLYIEFIRTHLEVAVDGDDGEECDAGAPVEEDREEHGAEDHLALAAPLAQLEVVGPHRQAEEQQDVGQHQVKQEDVVGVLAPPELELEDEEVDDGHVERQGQDELA